MDRLTTPVPPQRREAPSTSPTTLQCPSASGRSLWVAIAAAWGVRLVLAWLSLRLGFVEYNADGFTRVIHGYEWLQDPRWEVSVWLPLHFWLLGGTLALWDNLYLAPKLLATLAGLATITNLALVGATVAGRRAGALTALIVAAFPYEVWFSVSGMAEPVFHAFMSGAALGLVRWWVTGSRRPLVLGALSLMAATAVRYEGWFYAAVWAVLVLGGGWLRGRRHAGVVLGALLPFLFIGVWLQQNYAVFGDPLAFARETAAIKTELDPANVSASLVQRLLAYPRALLHIVRVVVVVSTGAALWLLVRHPRRWGEYAVFVGGQALLLILVTATFANLGPGAERYLLSNVVLLLPALAAAALDLWDLRPTGSGATARYVQRAARVVAVLGVVLLLASFGRRLAAPPRDYPDPDTRDLAPVLSTALREPDPLGRPFVPVVLPHPPADAFNAGYALRILTGQPETVVITDQPALLSDMLATHGARLWVIDTTAEVDPPPAARSITVGRFILGWPAGE